MADYQYINTLGVIVPDTSAILTDVQSEYKSVLGADLVTTPDTPQGVLITAETLSRTEVVNNNAALANQINPNVAGGIFLDAIMALLGLERIAATRSVIPGVVLSGVNGTIIPAGTQAQNGNGDVFASVAQVIIGSGGTATVDFASVEYGPIVCPENTLTQVVTSILGWETVTNPNAAVPGQNTQSDQAARAYRNNILAYQAVGLAEAVTSALYHVEGVTSLAFRENVENTTQVIDGISLVAHSIWACVRGGTDEDVAAALLENKSSGCNWNGATEVTLIEPASGQEYVVKFDRPAEVGILIKVTTPNGNTPDIAQAILNYVSGGVSGLAGFTVGSDANPYEITGAIITQFPSIIINKVELSYTSPVSWTTDILDIALDEIAVTQASYITVVTP